MSIPKISEAELKMAALSSALTDMLASLSYENLVLRRIVGISAEQYEAAARDFGSLAWQSRRDEIHQKIQELTRAALARMTGGTVQ